MFNEGAPGNTVTNGRVNIVTTAAGVNVSGQVKTAAGQPISNARVTISDATGFSRTFQTGPFGYYTFEVIPAGQTYIVTANAKQHSFNASLVAVQDSVVGLNLVANE